MYNSSKMIGLKPLKIKECNDTNYIYLTKDLEI
jgi:hypothetical protein